MVEDGGVESPGCGRGGGCLKGRCRLYHGGLELCGWEGSESLHWGGHSVEAVEAVLAYLDDMSGILVAE